MTQLSDKEHNVQMEDMKSFDEQMPCVGIFWYDPEDNTLFGVRKKEITPKMVEESRTQGVDVIDYPTSSLLHQPSDINHRVGGQVGRADSGEAHRVAGERILAAVLRVRVR